MQFAVGVWTIHQTAAPGKRATQRSQSQTGRQTNAEKTKDVVHGDSSGLSNWGGWLCRSTPQRDDGKHAVSADSVPVGCALRAADRRKPPQRSSMTKDGEPGA